MVWDCEGSCHVGRVSIVSSWEDYTLKVIVRDKKKKQSENITLPCLQKMNATFLDFAQAIHLVYK